MSLGGLLDVPELARAVAERRDLEPCAVVGAVVGELEAVVCGPVSTRLRPTAAGHDSLVPRRQILPFGALQVVWS